MVKISFSGSFEKSVRKIKDFALKERVKKQIKKIIDSPETGKPMRYCRKGTREVYVPLFRLSYLFVEGEIVFLELYHKDSQ